MCIGIGWLNTSTLMLQALLLLEVLLLLLHVMDMSLVGLDVVRRFMTCGASAARPTRGCSPDRSCLSLEASVGSSRKSKGVVNAARFAVFGLRWAVPMSLSSHTRE